MSEHLTSDRNQLQMHPTPLRLPQQAWKTGRLDSGAVRKTFGDPERATASRPTVAHSVTRDEGGVLVPAEWWYLV